MGDLEKSLHQKASNIRSMYVGAVVAFAIAAALLTGLAIYLSPSALSAFLPEKVISTGKHGSSLPPRTSTEITHDPNEPMTSETTASTNLSALDNTTTTATIPTTMHPWDAPPGCRECTKTTKGQLLVSANLKSGQINITKLGGTLVEMTTTSDIYFRDTTLCNVRAVLKITVPEGSVIRFDLVHGGNLSASGSTTFSIADSQYADGSSYKCEYHSSAAALDPLGPNVYSDDCAEMSSSGYGAITNFMTFFATFLPNWWHYTGGATYINELTRTPDLGLQDFTNAIRPSMTFWAGHQYMAATNYDTMNFCMDNDMVFLPKQPSKSPNNNIYFGMNRAVVYGAPSADTGLCEANVYLLESCMD